MDTLKSGFGVAKALLPVLYWGGLFYYFFDVAGSVQNAEDIGLGPTLIGLGVVGLLFTIPLVLKIVKFVVTIRSGGSDGPGSPPDDSDFDADAAIARYKAEKAAEAAIGRPASRPAQKFSPAKPAGFGRRR